MVAEATDMFAVGPGRDVLGLLPQEKSSALDSHDRVLTPPWSPRTVSSYSEIEDFTLDSRLYVRTHAFTNTLFDAFFYDILPEKVILWVLRMSLKRDHGSVKSGFEILKDLVQQAQAAGQPVELKSVLVVPYREPGWDVEWNFAGEFNEYRGEVFVQLLDLSVFGNGYKAEDVLDVDDDIV